MIYLEKIPNKFVSDNLSFTVHYKNLTEKDKVIIHEELNKIINKIEKRQNGLQDGRMEYSEWNIANGKREVRNEECTSQIFLKKILKK